MQKRLVVTVSAVLDELAQKLESACPDKMSMVGDEKNVRFFLGNLGKRPLIVFGVNPSTASEEEDDPTIRKVKRLAKLKRLEGYDGWIMLNLYPQRTPDPEFLDTDPDKPKKGLDTYNPAYQETNEAVVEEVLRRFPDGLLIAAWGNNVDKRHYLKACCQHILSCTKRQWYIIDTPTKPRNPRHPLYAASLTLSPISFDNDGKVIWQERGTDPENE